MSAARVLPLPECETSLYTERLIAVIGADFRIGGDKAFYVPSRDFIQVPPQPLGDDPRRQSARMFNVFRRNRHDGQDHSEIA